jgi:hypothetical protein
VDAKRTVAIAGLPDWRRLERAASANALWPALAPTLRARTVHPVIAHGDLAPWNVRISPQGNWMALDWKHGERDGIPGWDWFHYAVQTAILIERQTTSDLALRIEGLLGSKAFQQYAAHTGLHGAERGLALAYLLHQAEVAQPAEGREPTRELLAALAERWREALPG